MHHQRPVYRHPALLVAEATLNLYRVEHRGTLSNMASLSRAKDAALSIAYRFLENGSPRPQRRPPVRQIKRGATRVDDIGDEASHNAITGSQVPSLSILQPLVCAVVEMERPIVHYCPPAAMSGT
jgi:hypothetical protein